MARMLRVRSIPIMQQAALAVALGLTSAVAWAVMPSRHDHPRHFTLWLCILMIGGLGSYLAAIYLAYDVRTGVQSGRWPEPQIERFRSTFHSLLASGLHFAITLVAVAVMLYGIVAHGRASGSGWGLLMFSQVLTQLVMRCTRPAADQTADWRTSARLSSDHWGQAR
jgi:hypothetical protein